MTKFFQKLRQFHGVTTVALHSKSQCFQSQIIKESILRSKTRASVPEKSVSKFGDVCKWSEFPVWSKSRISVRVPFQTLTTDKNAADGITVVTVRTGSKEKAFSIINSLKIPLIISNIGDTKTLVIHPESTIAAHISDEEKQQSGVFEDLIRISVGIEDIEDLKKDFKEAIENNR